VLLGLGVFDQAAPLRLPPTTQLPGLAAWESDTAFVRRIEASLPRAAMVFQLPYVPFPEHPPVQRMFDYDHFRGYLHSTALRWTYGAMKGRPTDAWLAELASRPAPALVEAAALAGFAGIYVDRHGYADAGVGLELALAGTLGEPIASADGRLAFF